MSRWPRVKLKFVTAKLGSGSTPRGGDTVYKQSGVPLIRSMNVHFDGLRSEGLVYIDDKAASLLDHVEVQSGDVLFNITGASIGRVTTAPAEMAGARVNQHVCIIRPTKELMPRFLSYFLGTPEQQTLIGSNQAGGTRQAVTKAMLLNWEVPMPSLAEQERIVKLFDDAGELRKLRTQANRRTAALIPALFHEMFGDPITNPKGWTRSLFGEVGKLDRGRSKNRPRDEPSLYGGKYPFIQTGDVANSNGKIISYTQTYSEKGLAQSRLWPTGTLCITIAANIGKTAVLTFPACFPDSMVGFVPGKHVVIDYVRQWLVTMESRLEETAPQMAQKNINLKILGALTIPVPPLALQQEFAKRVTEIHAMQAEQAVSRFSLDDLFQSMSHQAFRDEFLQTEPQEVRTALPITQSVISPAKRHFARAVLSAEIVHQLHTEPTFGRIKHQKIFHLCEYIAELPQIAGQYHREAAGPLDSRLIYTNEAELKKQRWYEEFPRQKFGHAYRPLEKAGTHRQYAKQYWSKQLAVIEKLIRLMRVWDTERCEMFSTTYAAWNDLVLAGHEPTADAIVYEILENWHDSKKRISETRWREMIQWIRKEDFIPSGFGRPTLHKK